MRVERYNDTVIMVSIVVAEVVWVVVSCYCP